MSAHDWLRMVEAAFVTLARVLVTLALGTLWTVPVGIAIGLSPRLSRILQPIVQLVASFPAPMLYPVFLVAFQAAGIHLGIGSIVLMLLGTQWYMLFNVIAGTTAIPADLREAARSYRFRGLQQFWNLYFPALFPYLVTGWVTAAGGLGTRASSLNTSRPVDISSLPLDWERSIQEATSNGKRLDAGCGRGRHFFDGGDLQPSCLEAIARVGGNPLLFEPIDAKPQPLRGADARAAL